MNSYGRKPRKKPRKTTKRARDTRCCGTSPQPILEKERSAKKQRVHHKEVDTHAFLHMLDLPLFSTLSTGKDSAGDGAAQTDDCMSIASKPTKEAVEWLEKALGEVTGVVPQLTAYDSFDENMMLEGDEALDDHFFATFEE